MYKLRTESPPIDQLFFTVKPNIADDFTLEMT